MEVGSITVDATRENEILPRAPSKCVLANRARGTHCWAAGIAGGKDRGCVELVYSSMLYSTESGV